jgi:hypothetical protein
MVVETLPDGVKEQIADDGVHVERQNAAPDIGNEARKGGGRRGRSFLLVLIASEKKKDNLAPEQIVHQILSTALLG